MSYTSDDYDRYMLMVSQNDNKRYDDLAWAVKKIGCKLGLEIIHNDRDSFGCNYYGMTMRISIYNYEIGMYTYPIGHKPDHYVYDHTYYRGSIRQCLLDMKRHIDEVSWVNDYSKLIKDGDINEEN